MSLGEIWRYPVNQQPQLMLTEAVVSVAVILDHPSQRSRSATN
jgi:hypothetical protein